MKVEQVMSQPARTCSLNASVSEAGSLMLEGRCGVLPVLSLRGVLVGVVTDRDLCLATAVRRRSATQVAVHEAMSTKLATCGPGDDLKSALETMATAGVHRLPVIDGEGHLKGILSIDDIVLDGVGGDGVSEADIVETLRRISAHRRVRALEPVQRA